MPEDYKPLSSFTYCSRLFCLSDWSPAWTFEIFAGEHNNRIRSHQQLAGRFASGEFITLQLFCGNSPLHPSSPAAGEQPPCSQGPFPMEYSPAVTGMWPMLCEPLSQLVPQQRVREPKPKTFAAATYNKRDPLALGQRKFFSHERFWMLAEGGPRATPVRGFWDKLWMKRREDSWSAESLKHEIFFSPSK